MNKKLGNIISIKNGQIIDGTGKSSYLADLLIEGDKIREMGKDLNHKSGDAVIDAKGLVVAPGFIDIHSHLGFIHASQRHPEILKGWIYQGVTTLISGNCGMSPAPLNQTIKKGIMSYWNALLPREGVKDEWNTMEEYFKFLEKVGQVYNVGMLTGHNTLRTHVMDFAMRLPNKEELALMKQLLRESLQSGSLGLSFGLAYIPGIFSNTKELVELASVLKEFNPPLPLVGHVRGMFTKFYHEAVKEAITIAEKNQIPLQISHHAGGGLSRTRKLAIKAIAEAMKRGLKIGHDNIPVPTRRTTILKIFPVWLFEGGYEKFFERLRDPTIQEQVIDEILSIQPKWPPWENNYWLEKDFNENIVLTGFKQPQNKQFNNMRIGDIAKALDKEPLHALIQLVLEEHGEIFFFSGKPDDPMAEMYIMNLFKDPNCSVGTDIVGIDLEETPVPGAYGGFTKILETFVREKKIVSLEEAIRKMTSLPASQMQLEKRGKLEKDYYADIVIFNPAKVKCLATFNHSHRLSEGIEHVLINGIPVLKNGKYFPEIRAGKVLKNSSKLIGA
ncbi:MAG: N-acyl-D-amino-acid deacylase family protein [Promethearchaeota archaeon]